MLTKALLLKLLLSCLWEIIIGLKTSGCWPGCGRTTAKHLMPFTIEKIIKQDGPGKNDNFVFPANAMVKANYRDKPRVADILTQAFDDNKSVNYVIPQDAKRTERVRELMNYSFDLCHAFGDVFLSGDGNACALVIYPDQKKTTLRSLLWDARLILNCTGAGNVKKAVRRESLIRKTQLLKSTVATDHVYYLWFIGVARRHQHRGTGSSLMKELIVHSEEMQRPILLETSTLRNLPWYDRFGLKTYAELNFGYTLYFFERAAGR